MDAPLDEIEQRLRQAARVDDAIVERVARLVLTAESRQRRHRGAFAIAVGLACLVVLAVWSVGPGESPHFNAEASESLIYVSGPDGTSWIFDSGATPDSLPVGTTVVISEGGTP